MSCGDDSDEETAVYISGVEARGRSGYGINWGNDDPRNEGGVPAGNEQSEAVAVMSAVRKVLEQAEKSEIREMMIHISSEKLYRMLDDWYYSEDPKLADLYSYARSLRIKLSGFEKRPTVKFGGPCSFHCVHFRLAIFLARMASGTHSLSPKPINDNLFKNGVIGVAVYGLKRDTVFKSISGVYAHFFEEGFLGSDKVVMNKSGYVEDAEDEFDVLSEALYQAYETVLDQQYRQIRVKTTSSMLRELINILNGKPSPGSAACPRLQTIPHVFCLHRCFSKVEVDSVYDVGKARQLADKFVNSHLNGLYWKYGTPVVYTDASVIGHNTDHAVAGGGVFWGENDSRNRMCQVIGPQTSNSGEFAAVVKALKTAIEERIFNLIIRTDSQVVIDSERLLSCWRENGWVKRDGTPVKNREILEEMDDLLDQMQSVEFEKVVAHSGHEGNDGADRLAKEAARDAHRELHTPCTCCLH